MLVANRGLGIAIRSQHADGCGCSFTTSSDHAPKDGWFRGQGTAMYQAPEVAVRPPRYTALLSARLLKQVHMHAHEHAAAIPPFRA
jgi:hypothetical protein